MKLQEVELLLIKKLLNVMGDCFDPQDQEYLTADYWNGLQKGQKKFDPEVKK